MTAFRINLEKKINYKFTDLKLLLQALTHKSFSNEQTEYVAHNERFEFLGDAVLELVVSDLSFRYFPDIPEGGLTRIRAEVVSEKGLAAIASLLDLGAGLRLGKGEEKSGGREKPSLLSDALEALLGAIYLDSGFSAVYQVIENIFSAPIRESAQLRYGSDYKTCLQERLQERYNQLPEYQLAQVSGPDHERVFSMEVRFNGQLLGKGNGSSKKSAEQKAAAIALDHQLLKEES
ncbi:MAG: ribonuclease III [Deltaproteobacteria bacterium]|nr:ribonuclease III [Deltaproteobacteria bacterium]MCW8892613.1 ribonuclease III [Deltaproteobacteria bacterium]MCW9049548.1 ribonuclease III [Deltaproteobacteria bacterium]